MEQVILESWREGLEKVSLTKLQVEKLGIPLKEAKHNVDSLLNGQRVILKILTTELALEFFNEAKRIGVNCSIVKD